MPKYNQNVTVPQWKIFISTSDTIHIKPNHDYIQQSVLIPENELLERKVLYSELSRNSILFCGCFRGLGINSRQMELRKRPRRNRRPHIKGALGHSDLQLGRGPQAFHHRLFSRRVTFAPHSGSYRFNARLP